MFVPKSFVSKLLFLSKLSKETSIISCSVATKCRQSVQLWSWFIYNLDFCKIIFLIWKFRRNWHRVTLGGSLGQERELLQCEFFSGHNCKLPHCPHHSHSHPTASSQAGKLTILASRKGLLLLFLYFFSMTEISIQVK